MGVSVRMMASGAVYRTGPLSAGTYRPILWVRSEPTELTLKLRLNGVVLDPVRVPPGTGWIWVEPHVGVPVKTEGTAEVEISYAPSDPTQPAAPAKISVRHIDFERTR
jgi:hypothetical protein